MKNLNLLLLFLTFLFVNLAISQDKIDRIGQSNKNENSPVFAVRANGNPIIASSIESSTGDINILIIEYSLATSAIIREIEIGNSLLDEQPSDILEEQNGDILILGSRQGGSLATGASPFRQHGILFRIRESGTTFITLLHREFIPKAPNVKTFYVDDYQIYPMKMKLNTNGDLTVVGNRFAHEYWFSSGQPTSLTSAYTIWHAILDGNTLITINDDFFSGPAPSQIASLLLLTNGDILTTGYVNSSGLVPAVNVFDNTLTTRVSTSMELLQSVVPPITYTGSNFYHSALWNGQLILVGDYIPLGYPPTSHQNRPHDIIISKATIQNDRKILANVISGYNHIPSLTGNINDGNDFNDFRDFRVSNILVNGNELLVLGIVRDTSETVAPPKNAVFSEYYIMSIDLQSLDVNYTTIFSDMSTYSFNNAKMLQPYTNNNYLFTGSKDITSTNKDLIIGQFSPNTRLECVTQIEMNKYPIKWRHRDFVYSNKDTHTYNSFIPDSTLPDLTSSELCVEGNVPCEGVRDYVYYADESNIFTNTVWGTQKKGNKYYIDGTLTVNNVILDITNCDVVFGPCGQIVFKGDKSMLRANNSVFRPCEDTTKWNGLIFEGGSNHRILECEFKNAMTAINVEDDIVDINQIVNNTFLNNYISINLDGANISGSITGNHFLVNSPTHDSFYLDPICTPIQGASDLRFYAIRSINSVIWSPISNNDFVADDPLNSSSSKSWEFFGIYFSQSVGVIQKNEFTNNTSSIYQTGNNTNYPNFLNKIDNNEINLNRTINNALTQITIIGNETQNINTLITNNLIINNRRLSSTLTNYSGIYIESCNNTVIQQNEIRGFDIAINIQHCDNPEVSLNSIKGSYKFGIYAKLTELESINCNTIDLNYSNSTTNSIGIYLDECDQILPSTSKVHSNCIFNTEVAIQIYGPGGGISGLPSLRNNFLYNYLNYGILIGTDANGDIGDPVNPGMNTLARNSTTAIDIENLNLPLVTAYGNFYESAPSIGGTVVISGALGTTHSVASCGQQLSGPSSTYSGTTSHDFKCDLNGVTLLNPNEGEQTGGEEFMIKSGKDGSEFMSHGFFGYVAANTYGLVKKDSYLNSIKDIYNKGLISSEVYNKCLSQYAQVSGDYINAIKFLNELKSENELMSERIAIEVIRLKILGGIIDKQNSSQEEIFLNSIILKNNYNYNQAFYVKSLLNGIDDFKLPEIKEYGNFVNRKVLTMSETTQLYAYPNPVHTELKLEVISSANDFKGSGVNVKVLDIAGKIILSSYFDIVAGVIKLNLEDFPLGIYFVRIEFADSTTKTIKFIKG